MGLGKCTWWPIHDLDLGSRLWHRLEKFASLRNKVRTTHQIFSRSSTILVISQEWLVRLMWHEKEVHWLDTGYNMWPWSLTSFMTLTLDVSRSNFKGNELIWYWADCITLPFGHTHVLDLGVSRSESEIDLLGGRLTWNEKDLRHPCMTMILTSVTIVGWADVPDSDRGDFRRPRAVNIYSSHCHYIDWAFNIYIYIYIYILHFQWYDQLPIASTITKHKKTCRAVQ